VATAAKKEKAKECIEKIDPECKKAIKEGIKEKRKENPQTFIKNTITKCKNKFK